MDFKSKYGPYALITGASSGIGEEFAKQLAAQGFNLVLIARREELLKKLAAQLQKQHSIDIKVIPLDLAADHAMDVIGQQTVDLKIGLAIINAATFTAGHFLNNDVRAELNLAKVNAIAPLLLTHGLGNRMKVQGGGGIILVSSVAGHSGTPYQAGYAASKAFVSSLGHALHFEFKSFNIDLTVLTPGLTDTPGIPNAKALAGVDLTKLPGKMMNPTEVVSAALKGLGRKMMVMPGTSNKIADFVTKRFMSRYAVAKLMRSFVVKTMDKSSL